MKSLKNRLLLLSLGLLTAGLTQASNNNQIELREQVVQAAKAADIIGLQRLKHLGANLNERNQAGESAFFVAIGYGNLAMTKYLLAEGADVFSLDPATGAAPLNRAAQSGNLGIEGLLLSKGALIDHQAMLNGHTALIDAIFYRQPALVELLVKSGANIELKNHLGLTASDWAERQGIPSIKEVLSKKQIQLDAGLASLQPLLDAVKANDLEKVRLAIPMAEDINGRGKDGLTPLMDASRKGFTEVVALLLEAKANPNLQDRVMRATAGHKAAFFGRTNVLRLLIAAGLNIDAVGPYNGYTALHDAVLQNFPDTVRLLVCHGARLDVIGHDGMTPIALAEKFERPEIVQILLGKCKEGF